MPLISDSFHKNQLKKHNINIKTKYIVDNNILEKNTDNSHNDDIENGIRCEKQYYISNKLVHSEKIFDSRIEYTYISKNKENTNYTCPNCGMSSNLKDFVDGCPYCKTHYNIDYTNKDLGSKYHYDRVLKNKVYQIVTLILDFIISLIISFYFIKYTSRTFNSYDISKIFIYGFILALILYYVFYIIDAYIILSPIKIYKDKQNQKQIDFWKKTQIDKKVFFNNLNYELSKKYYSEGDIIDYDIIDFIKFADFIENDNLYVKVKVNVRVVKFKNNKISSKFLNQEYVMKKNNYVTPESDKLNVVKCHNCGASVDITKEMCDYCHTEIKYFQEWILVEKE